jgi:hypothetical protein
MKAIWRKVSDEFEAAKTSGGDVELRPDFYNKAGRAVGDYQANTPANSVVPSVVRRLDDFFDPKLMKGNSPYPALSSEQYQSFRKDIGDSMQAVKAGSAEYKALKGVREALDDAMEYSLPASRARAWQTVRRNWANLKILTKAASGGTSDSRVEGSLSPNALNTALRQAQGPDKFSRTTGGLNDIAHLKAYLADTLPNSGTPQTHAFHGMVSGGAGLAAAGVAGAHHFGHLSPEVALPAIAAAVVPNVISRTMAGKGLLATPVNRYLANQAMRDAYGRLYSLRTAPLSLAPSLPALEDMRQ